MYLHLHFNWNSPLCRMWEMDAVFFFFWSLPTTPIPFINRIVSLQPFFFLNKRIPYTSDEVLPSKEKIYTRGSRVGGCSHRGPKRKTQRKFVTILQKQAYLSQWHWELEDKRRDEGGRPSWTGQAACHTWMCFARPQYLEPSPFLALIWTVLEA